MEFIKLLMHQDPAILAPSMIGLLAVVNQVLKVVMATIRIGVMMSLAAALAAWLPHMN